MPDTPSSPFTPELMTRVAVAVAKREKRRPAIPTQLRVEHVNNDSYWGRFHDLFIICSESKEDDKRWWRHASVSRRDRQMPTYDDMKTLKRITMPDLVAYQLFMPTDKHIDLAGSGARPVQVLHLWACLDGPVTPDFSSGTGSI